jgi:hypothetical protein
LFAIFIINFIFSNLVQYDKTHYNYLKKLRKDIYSKNETQRGHRRAHRRGRRHGRRRDHRHGRRRDHRRGRSII